MLFINRCLNASNIVKRRWEVNFFSRSFSKNRNWYHIYMQYTVYLQTIQIWLLKIRLCHPFADFSISNKHWPCGETPRWLRGGRCPSRSSKSPAVRSRDRGRAVSLNKTKQTWTVWSPTESLHCNPLHSTKNRLW